MRYVFYENQKRRTLPKQKGEFFNQLINIWELMKMRLSNKSELLNIQIETPQEDAEHRSHVTTSFFGKLL